MQNRNVNSHLLNTYFEADTVFHTPYLKLTVMQGDRSESGSDTAFEPNSKFAAWLSYREVEYFYTTETVLAHFESKECQGVDLLHIIYTIPSFWSSD